MLWRDNESTNRPFVINLNTQETLISTGDLDFDSGWGIEPGSAFGAAMVGAGSLSILACSTRTQDDRVELADELALPGDLGLTTNNFFFADEVSVRYESQDE